jgi:hypothetical protein
VRLKFSYIFILFFAFNKLCYSQSDTITFNGKKEIVYDDKRYRVYNNWLSVGAGPNYNTKWPKDEKNIGVDFSFHLKQHYMRVGGFLSGTNFTSSNNYSFHLDYGIRKESTKYNLAAFVGPSLSYFRRPLKDTVSYNLATVYNEVGGHVALEAVYKIKYDIGIGGQIFCTFNRVQMIYGVRLILYFSSAYRGMKIGYIAPNKK